MKMEERREIYWSLYLLCEAEQDIIESFPVREKRMYTLGLCDMTHRLSDVDKKLFTIDNLDELMAFEPPKAGMFDFWFPLTRKGFEKRQDIVLQAIKATY